MKTRIQSIIWTVSVSLLLLLIGRMTYASTELPFLFHSHNGREHVIRFEAKYKASREEVQELINAPNSSARDSFVSWRIRPVMPYLMGPGTHRSLGGPKRQEVVTAHWDKVEFTEENAFIPYTYEATWIIHKLIAADGKFELPVPLNEDGLFTQGWKECGDSDPEHQTRSFFWYFWDPSRQNCEHKEGVHYQTVTVYIGSETPNQVETYPEYERLARQVGGQKIVSMTFAFGYATESFQPDPETDRDIGVRQYRDFLDYVRAALPEFVEEDISINEYEGAEYENLIIGHRFVGKQSDITYRISVVVNAGVDQMYLFAKSFAQDHDGFFAWFGHSRVGSGFDAQQFASILRRNPSRYSITDAYQVIYWGGCNSYSYYTLPFFKFKTDLNPELDPHGTKNLDIISNGLPSYFTLNAPNAEIAFHAFMGWPERRTSYQSLIRQLEERAWGTVVLTNVLGDEDNIVTPE